MIFCMKVQWAKVADCDLIGVLSTSGRFHCHHDWRSSPWLVSGDHSGVTCVDEAGWDQQESRLLVVKMPEKQKVHQILSAYPEFPAGDSGLVLSWCCHLSLSYGQSISSYYPHTFSCVSTFPAVVNILPGFCGSFDVGDGLDLSRFLLFFSWNTGFLLFLLPL